MPDNNFNTPEGRILRFDTQTGEPVFLTPAQVAAEEAALRERRAEAADAVQPAITSGADEQPETEAAQAAGTDKPDDKKVTVEELAAIIDGVAEQPATVESGCAADAAQSHETDKPSSEAAGASLSPAEAIADAVTAPIDGAVYADIPTPTVAASVAAEEPASQTGASQAETSGAPVYTQPVAAQQSVPTPPYGGTAPPAPFYAGAPQYGGSAPVPYAQPGYAQQTRYAPPAYTPQGNAPAGGPAYNTAGAYRPMGMPVPDTFRPVPEKAPEMVTPAQCAGFFTRFAAFLVDGVVAWVMTLVVGLLLNQLSAVLDGALGQPVFFTFSTIDIVKYLVTVTYFVLLTKMTGWTVGKRLLRIKVVSADGSPLRWFDVIYRETIGRYLSSLLCIGYLVLAFDKRHRGFHDMLCDTRVVFIEHAEPRNNALGATA